MLFWDIGATIWIFRYVFKDPGADLRALALGAVTANLVDKPISLLISPQAFDTARLYGHTLLFALTGLTLAVLLTRRGSAARKRAVAFAVGLLIHLLLDAMWTAPETLFWPAFGRAFPAAGPDTPGDILTQFLNDPVAIALEVAGLTYLAYLARRGSLGDRARRSEFLRTGRLEME